jgi:hypothetical protein
MSNRLKKLYSRTRPVFNVILTLTLFGFTIWSAMIALACGVQFWLVALVFGGALLVYSIKRWGRKILRYPATLFVTVLVVGCSLASADKPKYQSEMEKISDQIASKLSGAVPYPIDLMTDSLERRMLRERLLRFNKANKIGYLYVFNMGVEKPIGYYVIKGKVSATESQMSNPTQTWGCGTACVASADSIGDDGSFGAEEGGPEGKFWITTSGVMGETDLKFLYQDAPVPLWNDAPKLSNESQTPSSVSSLWQKQGGLGGG